MFSHIDISHWVQLIGYAGVLLIIFLETGLFFGFFLPGDSLLFSAGLLASQHIFNIGYLVPSIIVVAILGYQVAYWFGKKLGHWLLSRKDSLWFKRRYLEQAKIFYEEYGGRALIIGRLMPVVRTFVPIVAGMVELSYPRYVMLNVVGALMWAGGVTLLGYFLGRSVPNAEHYILPLVLLIMLASISPILWRYFRKRACNADQID